MSFCPQCGAPTQPGMSFCTACGAMLPTPPQAGVAPTAPAVAPMPGRPLGKVLAPWKIIVFPIITLGVYVYVFWWRIARELDAYANARASPLVRVGVLLTILGFVGTVIAGAQIVYPLVLEIVQNPETPPEELDISEEYLASPLYLGSMGVTVAGDVFLWIGLWRAWKALEADEAQRGVTQRANPSLFVGILAAGTLIQVLGLVVPSVGLFSFAALIAMFYVLYQTQSHLNATWVAIGAPPAV